MAMRFNHKGFTLIEMLVVIALLAIIMIGLLNLLDTSSKISVVETELADTQENVRFAAYHVMRTARMMGSAAMPFAANVGGSDHGMFTDRPGTLSNDFFVNLLDMSTRWSKSSTDEGIYEGRDRETGELQWKATPVDLIFGSHA